MKRSLRSNTKFFIADFMRDVDAMSWKVPVYYEMSIITDIIFLILEDNLSDTLT